MIELRRYQLEDNSSPVTDWLCGGDKSSQQSDIAQAKAYWVDWKRRNS